MPMIELWDAVTDCTVFFRFGMRPELRKALSMRQSQFCKNRGQCEHTLKLEIGTIQVRLRNFSSFKCSWDIDGRKTSSLGMADVPFKRVANDDRDDLLALGGRQVSLPGGPSMLERLGGLGADDDLVEITLLTDIVGRDNPFQPYMIAFRKNDGRETSGGCTTRTKRAQCLTDAR